LYLKLEQVLVARQMQGAGLGGSQPGPLLKQIGNVFAADGAELKRIRHRPGDLVIAVDLAEGDDLLHMVSGVEALVL
jgi:hypothetical protein